jgi:hypothetical protein
MVAMEPLDIWAPTPMIINQIVECPWEINPFHSLGQFFVNLKHKCGHGWKLSAQEQKDGSCG